TRGAVRGPTARTDRARGQPHALRPGHARLGDAPGRRADDLAARKVRAALRAVPAAEATWAVPLGCAHRAGLADPVRIAALRRSRARIPGEAGQLMGKRLRLLGEDNVPHIRDRIRRAAETAG